MFSLAWWHDRSQAERFDISFRSSFYVSFLCIPLLIASSVGAYGHERAAIAATVLSVGHMVLTTLLMHAGIEHYLGRRGRPTGLIVTLGAAVVLGSAIGVVAFPGHDSPAGPILLALTCTYVVGLAALRTLWPAIAVIGAGGVAMAVLGVARDAPAPLLSVIGLLLATGTLLLTYRSSLWMLHVVWELDRARTVQSSLAVTEERLRFARDMHDVLGRNLSVIALKSELAAQLAKRGRAEAVDEMMEVRRIAQDALADVRAIVGGYRHADLGDELAGARSLLASAGIECRVIGDGRNLPEDVQGTLGWVVREAVTNVLRHSDARACTITLHAGTPGTVTLTMDNDGTRTAGKTRFGSGLIGLAERIASLGGTLTATHEPPGRFLLTATVPVT